jgi:excisionase family DNA binding protein
MREGSSPSSSEGGFFSRRRKFNDLLKGEKMRDSDRRTDHGFLTVEELAELLRVPKSWLYSRTRTASLTGFSRLKLGRYVRFDKDEVIDWLRTNSSDDME